ncbi:MAG: VWA domain-containing protein [Acidobacteriota bacterium]
MKALRLVSFLLATGFSLSLLFVPQSGFGQQGPKTTNGDTVARPKKGTPDAPKEKDLPPIPSVFKKESGVAPNSDVTFRVDATTITLDVAVVDGSGHFIPGIPQGNFRILEDNVPQKISSMSLGEAPITIAMVIEFSNLFQQFYSEPWYQTLVAANEFLGSLKPEDYVAIIAYDLRPEILSDFSTDRRDAMDAMSRLKFAAYRETVLYDAITDTATRMQDIEGRKAILLISSGVDTISKQNYGEARKTIQNAGVPIYSLGLMQAIRDYYYQMGYQTDSQRTDFLMADNQLRTFSQESGGLAFFPRFYGQFREIFQTISQAMRTQYVLTYVPTNSARDGKFRKLKIELVDPATNKPLRVTDPKGKNVKYQIVTKAGYTAARQVE